MANIRLVSYTPLCFTPKGKKIADQNVGFSYFYDGSIRPEPSLEQDFPGISSLCRANKLAPTLKKDDILVYITNKNYYGLEEKHWKLVAVLWVNQTLDNHLEAAQWYLKNGYKLPKNCVVAGNEPYSSEKSILSKKKSKIASNSYNIRAKDYPQYNICKPVFKNIDNPSPIFESDFYKIFGKVPGLQMPPFITWSQLDELLQIAIVRQYEKY